MSASFIPGSLLTPNPIKCPQCGEEVDRADLRIDTLSNAANITNHKAVHLKCGATILTWSEAR